MKAPWTAWIEYKQRREDRIFEAVNIMAENLANLVLELAKQRNAIEEQKLDVLRKQLPIEGKDVPKKPDAPLPADIVLYVRQESEKWAQEDMEKLARQYYDEYGEWDKVREILSAKYGT